MPNLALFWHFPTLADRAFVPLTKVDQLCKTFSKLDLKMPNVQKCQIWHILGVLKWWQMEWFFLLLKLINFAKHELQQRYGLVIEQEQSRRQIIQKLSSLKNTDGPSLQEYHEQVACLQNHVGIVCNQESYYNSDLRWQGFHTYPLQNITIYI